MESGYATISQAAGPWSPPVRGAAGARAISPGAAARRATLVAYTAVPQASSLASGCRSREVAEAAAVPGRPWGALRTGVSRALLPVALLVASLLAIGGWLGIAFHRELPASGLATASSSAAAVPAPGLWQQEPEAVSVSWVGCFTADGSPHLDKGPGYNTVACAQECRSYLFMTLQGGGRCICENSYAKKPTFQQVDDSRCGAVCTGEDGLTPSRYCGAEEMNAVYRLQTAAPDDSSFASAEEAPELVGTWLFGSDESKCYVTRTDGGKHLRFGVPLPNDQTAFGILQPRGQWLQAELVSNDGELVGTIRLHVINPPGTIVSNFKYPGEAVWGKDTIAHKASTTTTSTAQVAIDSWEVVTAHGLVQSAKGRSSPVIGTKTKGSIVRGWRKGTWIGLVDEPGFMLIANGDQAFLKKATSAATTTLPFEEGLTWRVVTPHGLNVRSAKDTTSSIIAVKSEGTVVHGRQEGNWVRLLGAPGFMLIANNGNSFLKQVEATTAAPSTNEKAEIYVWKVMASHGLKVRSMKDSSSEILDIKLAGSYVRGEREGNWIKLAGEPGYMMVSAGDSIFLDKVKPAGDRDEAPATTTTATATTTTEAATSTTVEGTTSTTRTTTTTVQLCEGDKCSVKPFALRCLEWQEQGCHQLKDKDMCLRSLDGREAVMLDGKMVHGQPCVWCGGKGCANDSRNVCEPLDNSTWAAHKATWKRDGYRVANCEDRTWPSLYCFALMMPSGYEPQLLGAQVAKGIGIFSCDSYTVFSNVAIALGKWGDGAGPNVVSELIEGSLHVEYGGKWHTALNTGVFIRVWQAVVKLAIFERHDWTAKADPDAVFFPDRLRSLLTREPMRSVPLLAQRPSKCGHCTLSGHTDETCDAHVQWLQTQGKNCSEALTVAMQPSPTDCDCTCDASSCQEGANYKAMFLVNCRWGLHGPLEVLSREAVATFISSYPKCDAIRAMPYGEDKYLDQCLTHLGVRRIEEYSVLEEAACPAKRGVVMAHVDCASPSIAFHPYKAVPGFFKCWHRAVDKGVWP